MTRPVNMYHERLESVTETMVLVKGLDYACKVRTAAYLVTLLANLQRDHAMRAISSREIDLLMDIATNLVNLADISLKDFTTISDAITADYNHPLRKN